ncbi:MAG: aspartate--tRNA ligase [Candidatus Pacebacteria bacterium]|nr:aspartate--tRNA ligase [Candidatus Paceibacterota bacterium]
MQRTYINELKNHIGKEVLLYGWVDVRRDHGKLIFFDLRDSSGIVQMVVLPNHKEAIEKSQPIRDEWVLEVKGKVNARPEKMVNANELNGEIEIEALEINILNEAKTPPFDIRSDGKEINEEVRLKYRYLDLRRGRLQKNIKNRFKVQKLIRNHLSDLGFHEIETPLMSAPTPEGSRSYMVPSRLWHGKFYALPQSPQQYKQLLMVAGFERYFQFAHCMRDEDTRGDRQPEFTQLDLELSFTNPEEVMKLNEELLIKLVKEVYPNKKIQQVPFPRISHKEALEKYGSDKPDIREDKNDPNSLAFLWVTDFPAFEKTGSDNIDGTGEWTFTHNPFSRPQDKYLEDFRAKKNIGNILTTQYDITLNGFEIGGGSIRNHNSNDQKTVLEIMGYNEERIQNNFGHMLEALSSGAPPHGGIAWGFDRLIMILENEPNIREVIAFAKTGEGKDLMMGSPSEVGDMQLKELGISLRDNKKK